MSASREMVEFFLKNAAGSWVQTYAEEVGDSFAGPGNEENFVWRARQIYRDELLKRGVGVQSRAKRPLAAVCDEFPDDGLPVLYMHIGETGECLYVGKSMHARKRQQMHRQNSYWWDKVRSVEFGIFPDQISLGIAEIGAIKSHRPKHNIDHNGERWNGR